MVSCLHITGIIILYLCLATFSLWNADLDMIRCDLQQIPVSGYKCNFHSFCLRAFCDRTQYIICFQSCLLYDLNPHSFQYLFHDRNLLTKFLRHRLTGTFVFLVYFMTECRCMHIKSHSQIFGLLFFQYFK